MENTNKKTIISLVIGILSLVVVIVGATYAYWSAKGIVNFNTATITYETASKTVLTLNGTTGLLTLGTITSNDMSVYDTERIYYASATGKKTTPTEETIGEVRTPVGDLNTYRCNFTLALTHGGSADLIDRFLSETNGEPDYENRSAGQIILTVNGVEYDLNDGFPSTINGTLNVQDNYPGKINVGMKFINLSNVNQIYLKNTNGAINITVTDFSCETYESSRVFYWSYQQDTNYNHSETFYNNAKKFDDYSSAINGNYYEIIYNDNGIDTRYHNIKLPNEFNSLAECEEQISLNNYNYDNYSFPINRYECRYIDNKFKIYDKEEIQSIDSVIISGVFSSQNDCERMANLLLSNNNAEVWTVPNGTTSLNGNNKTIRCELNSVYLPVFMKSTEKFNISKNDKWQLFFNRSILPEEKCNYVLNSKYDRYHIDDYYTDLEASCEYIGYQNYYYLRINAHEIDLHDYTIDNLNYMFNFSNYFSPMLKKVYFSAENDCLYYANIFDFSVYNNEVDNAFWVSNPACVKTQAAGDIYSEIQTEMCFIINNENICAAVDDEDFDVNDYISDLENNNFECNKDGKWHCTNDNYVIEITDNYSGNDAKEANLRIMYNESNDNIGCYLNNTYAENWGIYCTYNFLLLH